MIEAKERRKFGTVDLVQIAIFTVLIAVGAFIRIPIPVVPFTLQTLFVGMAGIVLGGAKGAISVIVYIVLGLCGLPIFSQGGGIGYVFMPTFGYLIGFIIATFVIGTISHRGKASFGRYLISLMIGIVIIYLFGVVYFYFIGNFVIDQPMAIGAVLWYCCVLFIPGDVVSMVVVALLSVKLVPLLRKYTQK